MPAAGAASNGEILPRAAGSMSVFDRDESVLPGIHPNAGVEAGYRRQLQAMVREMAQSMLWHIGAVYKRIRPGFGVGGQDPVSSVRDALSKWGDHWIGNIEEASHQIGAMFARRVWADLDRRMMNMLVRAGFAVRFKPTLAMKQAYRLTIAEQVNLIKSIPQQFLKDVQTSVWQSVMKGADMGELTRTIQNNYGVAHRRAALIARDQNNKAKAIMEAVRREELGITQAIWIHSGGGKEPRPTHLAMNGKRFDVKKGMWDSHEQKWVQPGELINCRCVSRSIIPGLKAVA